jgi:hypothetical protein
MGGVAHAPLYPKPGKKGRGLAAVSDDEDVTLLP